MLKGRSLTNLGAIIQPTKPQDQVTSDQKGSSHISFGSKSQLKAPGPNLYKFTSQNSG